jgi:hypothetical protein
MTTDDSGFGGPGLASMLFMDLATIYMISECLESAQPQPAVEPNLPEQENYNVD